MLFIISPQICGKSTSASSFSVMPFCKAAEKAGVDEFVFVDECGDA